MAKALCTECGTGLVMEVARALTRTDETMYHLTTVKLFRCPRCGSIFVPENAGRDVSPEAVVATRPEELCDILFAGQHR